MQVSTPHYLLNLKMYTKFQLPTTNVQYLCILLFLPFGNTTDTVTPVMLAL